MSCVLRVSGIALDVDALLSRVSLAADRVWRKGEPRGRNIKRLHTDSGATFLASGADLDEFERQATESAAFLESHIASVAMVAAFPGVEEATLDFGVAASKGGFVTFSYLPPALVRLAAQANIGIEISNYVCSDGQASPNADKQRIYVDFSIFAPAGAVGVIDGYLEYSAIPRSGEDISFMSPNQGVLPLVIPGFTGLIKVERIVHSTDVNIPVALSLADVTLTQNEHVSALVQFMEQGFGLGFIPHPNWQSDA